MTKQPHHTGTPPARKWTRPLLIACSITGTMGFLAGPAPLIGIAGAAPEETPEQRCARETADYNRAQETLWRATHPGQDPTGQPWPPYICAEIPTPPGPPGIPPASPGADAGADDSQPPGRTHQWEGFNDDRRQYADDMRLGELTSPHTGLADRMNNTTTTPPSTGGRAGDTARSNVPTTIPQWVDVDTTDGPNRTVRVVDSADGQLVVDDQGITTGEAVIPNPDGGYRIIPADPTTAGRQLTTPHNGRAHEAETGPGDKPETPAGGDEDNTQPTPRRNNPTTSGDEGQVAASSAPPQPAVPVGPLGAAGVLAGMAGALAHNRSRSRGGRGGVPRLRIRYPWGTQQTVFMLTSPDSARVQRFNLDIPDGGHASVRDDGGVDVIDADGRVVRRVDPPWAFDATGKPVPTHYEVDPDTGELVQTVNPSADAVYPIIADPSQAELDRTVAARQPGFIGPVTADDAAGQARNRARQGDTPNGDNESDYRYPGTVYDGDDDQSRSVREAQRTADNNSFARAANGNTDPSDEGAAPARPEGRRVVGDGRYPTRGTDSVSDYGDRLGRGYDGRITIYPREGDRVTHYEDGSVQVVRRDGSRTRYFPTPNADELGNGSWVQSVHYDPATNLATQRVVTTGETVEYDHTGLPDTIASQSSPEGRGALATFTPREVTASGVPIPQRDDTPVPTTGAVTREGIVGIRPARRAGGRGVAEVHPVDGRPTYTVDAATGDFLHLGTPERPIAGPPSPPRPHQDGDVPVATDAAGQVRGPNWMPGWRDAVPDAVTSPTGRAFELAGESAIATGDDVARGVARVGTRSVPAVGGVIGAEIDAADGMDRTEAYVTNAIGVGVGVLVTGGLAAAAPVAVAVVGGATVGWIATKASQYLYAQFFGDKE